MRYDRSEFTVQPGAKVKLTLENEDQLQHNLVLLRTEGDLASGLQFAQSVWAEGRELSPAVGCPLTAHKFWYQPA